MKQGISAVKKFWQEEDGVTAIEYGLIAALIAVGIIASVTLVRNALQDTFNKVANNLS